MTLPAVKMFWAMESQEVVDDAYCFISWPEGMLLLPAVPKE